MKPQDGSVFVSDFLKAQKTCAEANDASIPDSEKEKLCVKDVNSKDKIVAGIDGDLKCEWTIKPQDYHRSVNKIFYDPKEVKGTLSFKKTCAAATEKGIRTNVTLSE
jgi:hypothetical protein